MRNLIVKKDFLFAFDQNACSNCNGACCRGESGYIWLNKQEIVAISSYLDISFENFLNEYCKKVGYKYTLKELKQNNEYLCVFFEENKGCKIYPVRPKQCKDYPFWERYKKNKNIHEVCKECPGILFLS